jgi:hypothetical protein
MSMLAKCAGVRVNGVDSLATKLLVNFSPPKSVTSTSDKSP